MINSEAQPPHILIIDDDLDQLRLLIIALRNTPYRVSVALNGDQGYARATALLPDLIFLDVRMPGRSGITVARLLKTNPATEDIPILFLSALADNADRLEGLKAGGVDYINKPFDVDEILDRARIHLSLSRKNAKALPKDSDIDHQRTDPPPATPAPANSALKQVAVEFIFKHIGESSLKIADVSHNLGVSTRRLNAVFEDHDGISVFEFIRQERMRRAALMLGQTTLAVADISVEVGYANPANFSTEFKKFWKKSPKQLRSEFQLNGEVLSQLIASKNK